MVSSNLNHVFKAVAAALAENQQDINQADQLHHDHGDNMVEIFNVISNAVEKKKSSSASSQMKYAGKQLEKKIQSGTAQLYAEGLKEASQKFSGKQLDAGNALDFVQTLLGGLPNTAAGGAETGNMLGSLLTGMLGSDTQTAQQTAPTGDLLSGILGNAMNPSGESPQTSSTGSPVQSMLAGLLGGSSQADDGKFDLSDVVQIGMSYLQARQSGSSDLQALAGALLNRTQMGQKEHRSASGKVVAGTLLEELSKFSQ